MTNRPGEIDLGMRAKDEKQFVRWRDFQAAFDADRIVVYAHHRNGRYVESVTNTHCMVCKGNCRNYDIVLLLTLRNTCRQMNTIQCYRILVLSHIACPISVDFEILEYFVSA